jgi:NADH dehydrogenase (ubiquinone) Fe-S protein 5
MASGYSIRGGEGRCYSFWLAFKRCMLESPDTSLCTAFREDYEECLHHRKAIRRFNAVVREFERREAAGEKLPRPEEMPLESPSWADTGTATDPQDRRDATDSAEISQRAAS